MLARRLPFPIVVLVLVCTGAPAQNPPVFLKECATVQNYYDAPQYSNTNLNRSFVKGSNNEFLVISNVLGQGQYLHKLDHNGYSRWNWQVKSEGGVPSNAGDFGIDGSGDAFLLAYNYILMLSAAGGNEVWRKTFANMFFPALDVSTDGTVHAIGSKYFDNIATVYKYNKSGVLQWSKDIATAEAVDVAANEAGEVFALVRIYNGDYEFYLVKFSAAGVQQYQVKVPFDYFWYSEIVIGPDNNLYLVGSNDITGTILKIRTSDGAVLGNKALDIGSIKTAFGPSNELYAFGPGSSSYRIYRFPSNFNPVTVVNRQEHVDPDNASSIVVESNGSISITYNSFLAGSFVQFNSSGQVVGRLDEFNPIYGVQIDHEGNYLLPSIDECLIKLKPCAKLQVGILVGPDDKQVCEGSTVTWSITASGASLNYQWYKNGQPLANDSRISGANTATLTIKNANEKEDGGNYYCAAANACNVTNTRTASLTFAKLPAITKQPTPVSSCQGSTATFEITANTTGARNVRYQWKKGTTVLADGSKYSGTKTNKLTINTLAADDGGDYVCEVLADCHPAVVSQKAGLTVLASAAITTQPASVATCDGNSTTLAVVATGAGLTYQWKKGSTNINDDATFAGTKTSQLTIKNVNANAAGTYSCVITSTCGSVSSSNTTVSISTPPSFTKAPSNASVCSGASATFSVTASAGATSYVWRKGNTIITNSSKYSGATTATLTINNISAADEGTYTCSLPNSCGADIVSAPGLLTVTQTPTITATSQNLNICEDAVAVMSVETGQGSFTYQWKKKNVNLNDGGKISGTKSPQLLITGVANGDAGDYTCEVRSTCGATTSRVITLAVMSRPQFLSQPASSQACEGSPLTLTAEASTSGTTYRWKKDGVALSNTANITGVTTKTLTIKSLTASDRGNYWCEVTNGCATIISSVSTIDVNPAPKLSLQPTIPCVSWSELDWDVLVTDANSTFGTFAIFREGGAPMTHLAGLAKGTYFITKSNGICADTVVWDNTCIITSIENQGGEIGSVFPNPASDIVNVTGKVPFHAVEILDALGRVVAEGRAPDVLSYEFDVSNLSGGVYFVRIHTSGGERSMERIVINRE